jgi:plasmid stability protein
MTVITIRNVPDEVNEKLKQRAAERGQSVQQFLLRTISEAAEQSPLEQRLLEVIARSPKVEITADETVQLIEDGRRERDESIQRALRGEA